MRVLADSYAVAGPYTDLAHELANVDSYVGIMKVRFGENFDVDYRVEEKARRLHGAPDDHPAHRREQDPPRHLGMRPTGDPLPRTPGGKRRRGPRPPRRRSRAWLPARGRSWCSRCGTTGWAWMEIGCLHHGRHPRRPTETSAASIASALRMSRQRIRLNFGEPFDLCRGKRAGTVHGGTAASSDAPAPDRLRRGQGGLAAWRGRGQSRKRWSRCPR